MIHRQNGEVRRNRVCAAERPGNDRLVFLSCLYTALHSIILHARADEIKLSSSTSSHVCDESYATTFEHDFEQATPCSS
jgi:hypothetical protein